MSDAPIRTGWHPLTALRYTLANWLLLLVDWVTPRHDDVALLDAMTVVAKRNAAHAKENLHAD